MSFHQWDEKIAEVSILNDIDYDDVQSIRTHQTG